MLRRSPAVPPNPPNAPISLVWYRGHDLRVEDHAALDAAVASGNTIVALYILERGAETDGASSYMQTRNLDRYSAVDLPSFSDDNVSHFSDLTAPSNRTTSTSRRKTTSVQPSDNLALAARNAIGASWGPLSPNGGFALGRVQRWYLHHSLCVLQSELEKLGITLVLRRVDSADDTVVEATAVATALGAGSVYWNKRYKPRAYPVDEAVKAALQKHGIASQEFASETLVEPNISYGIYNDFQSYTRFWLDCMRVGPPNRPHSPIRGEDVMGLPKEQVKSLLTNCVATRPSCNSSEKCLGWALPDVQDLDLLLGVSAEGDESPGNVKDIGCVAARRNLASFLSGDRFTRFASPRARRDGMVTAKELATSRLSPHVRFGEMSPRYLFYAVVDAGEEAFKEGTVDRVVAARTFLKNMSLRDFGYYMLTRYPAAACKPIMPEFEVFPWEKDRGGRLLHAWETGTTGFPIVDAAMRQLLKDGWLHNRMRFLAASFFCKYLLLPWPVGAAHMVRTLVDGDEACNSLGWQWTVGCNSDSFPFSTLVNPLSLHTHTQSRRKAAGYIRQYVPELAHLPDHLVFAPWKVTAEEQTRYNFNVIPLADYLRMCGNRGTGMTSQSTPTYYPVRVVEGREARIRARRAMEVMRRIFAAQRQFRTIIVDQGSPHSRRPLLTSSNELKKQRVAASPYLGADDDDVSIIEIDATISDFSLSEVSKPSAKRSTRSDEKPEEVNESAPKRRRTVESAVSPKRPRVSKSRAHGGTTAPLAHPADAGNIAMRNEVPLLGKMGPRKTKGASQRERTRDTTSTRQIARKKSAGSMHSARHNLNHTESVPVHPKRPRSPPAEASRAADARLSVKSLLSPSLSAEVGAARAVAQPTPEQPLSGLPKLAHVASYQQPAAGQVHRLHSNGPSSPDIVLSPLMSGPYRSPGLGTPAHPQATGNTQLNVQGGLHPPGFASPTMSGSLQSPFLDRPGLLQMAQGNHVGIIPKRSNVASSSIRETGQPSGNGNETGSASRTPLPRMTAAQNDERNRTLASVNVQRAQRPGMYPTNISAVPMVGHHFQPAPQHSPPVMLQYRQPSGHMPMHLNHAANQLPNASASQGYFAAGTLGAHAVQPPNQPIMWYPTMPQYMDLSLRGAPLPSGVVQQVVHPVSRQHPQGIPVNYPMPTAGAVGVPSDPRMMHAGGVHTHPNNGEGSARRGPQNPMERENIARRMAAMDYNDETYGGKHWEQWQAIALHLLNQYEFSEDTDRETSRAYVRLCVLKDELRDANRNGPRVTVNHCKEVFRILNLPVTGEWDRRGHGGVRGPYVYGCVKRNGAQVPRR